MLIAVDIGNTNITLGGYSGESLIFTARIATDIYHTSDQYAMEIGAVLNIHNCAPSDIEDIVMCSVVPTVGSAVSSAFLTLCSKTPLSVGPGVKTGMSIKIDNPAQLGADLVAGAVGYLAHYPVPAILIDMGTATTISVINDKKEFLGGTISAGIGLCLEALCGKTAALTPVDLKAPKSVIGPNTAESMRAGIVTANAAMIDGLIDRIEEKMGKCTVVATGGIAQKIIPECKRNITVDNDLLLEGLRIIYYKNKVIK